MLRPVQCTFQRLPSLLVLVVACSLSACGGDGDPIRSPVADPAESVVKELSKKGKVLICHKGKDKRVPESALRGHLRHGDTVGACSSGATCPCYDTSDIVAAANGCSTTVTSTCSLGDPAFLLLACDPGGSVPPGVLGIYLTESPAGDGGTCSRDDVNGMLTQTDLGAAEFQACVDVLSASGFCT